MIEGVCHCIGSFSSGPCDKHAESLYWITHQLSRLADELEKRDPKKLEAKLFSRSEWKEIVKLFKDVISCETKESQKKKK